MIKVASTYIPGNILLTLTYVICSSQKSSEVGTITTSILEKSSKERLDHLPKVTQYVNC